MAAGIAETRHNGTVKSPTVTRPRPHSSDPAPLRVLWLTNVAAPYRVPVWEHIAKHCTLRIGLLEAGERLLGDASMNRGADWAVNPQGPLDLREYSTGRVARGEHHYYYLRDPRILRDVAWADVILMGGWESPAYWAVWCAAKTLRRPMVGFYESTLNSQAHSRGPIASARRIFFAALDSIVVPGPAAAEAVAAMGLSNVAVRVGFNAIDTARFSDVATAPHRGHAYAFVGQLIPRKNIDGIMRAFSAAREDGDTLTIIGGGSEKRALEALAERLGILEYVTWISNVPNSELPTRLAAIDTLVLASHTEVWGLVANEALAAGRQVVVTSNCGVAPSIASMPGVYQVDIAPENLVQGMIAARSGYAGPIADPPIRLHTPEAFGDIFLQAFNDAVARRTHTTKENR